MRLGWVDRRTFGLSRLILAMAVCDAEDRMTMQHGLTPLHIAVQEGHHEGIGLLLDFGAEKDKPCRDTLARLA